MEFDRDKIAEAFEGASAENLQMVLEVVQSLLEERGITTSAGSVSSEKA